MRYNTSREKRETKNGIYQLLIYLPRKSFIRVGKKGSFKFPRGYYVYTGSAKKGLKSRIQRHLRKNKKRFWHIDYLLQFAQIEGVRIHIQKSECYWNNKLLELGQTRILVNGFGSSDCKCRTHLLYSKKKPELNSR